MKNSVVSLFFFVVVVGQLKTCADATNTTSLPTTTLSTTTSSECDVCETVISIVQKWVMNNSTENQVQRLIDPLCYIIFNTDPEEASVCVTMINTVLPEIWNIVQQTSPQALCQMLDLCSIHNNNGNNNNNILKSPVN